MHMHICASTFTHTNTNTHIHTRRRKKKKQDNLLEMKVLLTGTTMAVCLCCVSAHGGQQEMSAWQTSETPLRTSTHLWLTASSHMQEVWQQPKSRHTGPGPAKDCMRPGSPRSFNNVNRYIGDQHLRRFETCHRNKAKKRLYSELKYRCGHERIQVTVGKPYIQCTYYTQIRHKHHILCMAQHIHKHYIHITHNCKHTLYACNTNTTPIYHTLYTHILCIPFHTSYTVYIHTLIIYPTHFTQIYILHINLTYRHTCTHIMYCYVYMLQHTYTVHLSHVVHRSHTLYTHHTLHIPMTYHYTHTIHTIHKATLTIPTHHSTQKPST